MPKNKKSSNSLKRIEPAERLTNATYGRSKIVELNYPKGNYSKSDIEKLVKIQQDKYRNTPLMFMPSIRLDRGYRSVKAFGVDANFKLDLYGSESENTTHFAIYVWKLPEKKGGYDDKHNDCLYHAIVKSINKTELKDSWANPVKFKKRLHLDRDDKVDISDMSTIENALKININVIGDHTYISGNNYSKTANIKLKDGHYDYHCKKSNELIKTISYKNQKILFIYRSDADISVYDGFEIEKWTLEKYFEVKDNIFGKYVLLHAKCMETLIKEYDEFYKHANIIKTESNGFIDYFQSGGRHKNAALKLFYNQSRGIEDPEQIDEIEEEWIRDAMMGALVFGTKCTLNDAKCYDVNSAYAYAMQFSGFKIPIKRGDFKMLEELPEILSFGIYCCHIEKSGDYDTNKLFKFNKSNKYTHIDINVARKLKLKVNLIKNKQANCLLYGAGKCINASKMFKTTVDYLYQLKRNDVKFAKRILTALWGGLCQTKKSYKCAYNPADPINIDTDNVLLGIQPVVKGDLILYAKKGHFYKTNYARMGPFLTAFVRKMMADAIFPHKEHVHRCHTDSILSDVDIDLKLSSDIGQWKIEHSGQCTIKNAMEVIWN